MRYPKLERAYARLKVFKSVNELKAIRIAIAKCLCDITGIRKDIIVRYQKRMSTDDFYGMYIMPLDITNYATKMIDPESKIPNLCDTGFIMTIDSKLVDNATPEELTAITLHEIGHLVMDDGLNKAIRAKTLYSLAGAGVTAFSILTMTVLAVPICVMYITASSAVINNMTIEAHADSLAIEQGYGSELESVFKKIRLTQGKNSNMREANLANENNIYMKWSIGNLATISTRRYSIQRQIEKFNYQYNHPTIPTILERMSKLLIREDNESVNELGIRLSEGLSFNKKFDIRDSSSRNKLEKDITYLQIMLRDDLKDIGDKCEYTETTFKLLKKVELATSIESNPDYIKVLNEYARQLYNIRDEIARKELPKHTFGILLQTS